VGAIQKKINDKSDADPLSLEKKSNFVALSPVKSVGNTATSALMFLLRLGGKAEWASFTV